METIDIKKYEGMGIFQEAKQIDEGLNLFREWFMDLWQ